MNSALFRGSVRHSRLRPVEHSFRYRVFHMYVDVEELVDVGRRLRLFSHNRFNLFALYDSDHGPDDGTPLADWVHRLLGEAGVDLGAGRIMLLAYPRVLGYVFDPLSVWYCFGPDEDLRALVYEVRNTFGDKHSYVVPVDSGALHHSVDKRLHVSPFMDMDQVYRFAVTPPADHFSLGISVEQEGEVLFRASMSGQRLPLTDRNLLRLFATHPLITWKTIAAIHWQAFFVWIKRVGFRRRPEPANRNVTIVQPEEALR